MELKKRIPALSLGLDDFGQLWASKKMRLALAGILIIPVVYSFIYLKAFYDPYQNMKYLPVAVVNEDKGTVKDGEPVDAGKDLVKELGKDSKLKWEFVSRTQLMDGLKEGKYYFGIIIPRDFSETVVSVNSPAPLRSKLIYVSDESNNYLAGRLGQSIRKDLEQKLDEKLTHVYVDAMFKELSKSTNDLAKAANGAKLLAESTVKAAKGSERLRGGLTQVTQGASKLEAGNRELVDGLAQMRDALAMARDKVKEPMDRILAAQTFVHQVNDAIQRMAKEPLNPPQLPVEELRKKSNKIRSGLADARDRNEEARRLLEQMEQENPTLVNDPRWVEIRADLKSAENRAQDALGAVDGLDRPLSNLQIDVNQWQEWRKRIAEDSQKITDTVDQKVVQYQKITQDADRLVTGADQLLQGARQLEAGQEKLLAGVRKLEQGARKLQDGLNQINDGQEQLADGLDEGVQKAKEQLKGADKKEDVISAPVAVNERSLHPVPNYATGLAPYFISLSLWVGAMFLFTVVDLYKVLDKPGGEPLSFPTGAVIGAGQAVILSTVLMEVVGIHPKLMGWYYVFPILISFTFIAINQMLVALFKNPGRFLSILLLMLQLTSSGGTYPIELLPGFFQHLHPWLPMTYSVHGMRAILSSGNADAAVHDAYILLGFMCGAFAVTEIFTHGIKPLLTKAVSALQDRKAAA
jgi:putative membrane protein